MPNPPDCSAPMHLKNYPPHLDVAGVGFIFGHALYEWWNFEEWIVWYVLIYALLIQMQGGHRPQAACEATEWSGIHGEN